ncbi:cation:proton antiporter [Halobacterium zhouii]|uniref:cation:proton antiporter n=1 Tax=Halobacterium zhouii TaxID=2902624 RepID=UPI001E2A4A26|nr:cation:proton antiporter [Halobacterium zhouii]
MVETTAVVLGVLVSFSIAIGVRFLANRTLLPYTVLLVTVGFVLTVFPLQTYLGFSLNPLFTHDAILFIFLPAIVFLGAAEIDHDRFRRNLPIVVITVLVGLPVAVLAIGWVGAKLFEMPLLIMLLFGAMAYPIDPVAVLSLFEDAGAPPRLAVLVEGESLLDDGLAIVVFSALLVLVRDASPTELTGTGLFSLARLGTFVIEFLVVSLGGTLVGIGIGYATYRVQRVTKDQANLFMTSFMAVYGGFYVAEHVLHVSGILATVVTGLVLGTWSRNYALSEENLEFLVGIWESIVFLLETMLFVAIGIQVSSRQVLSTLPIVLTTFILLIGVRAGVIYGIMNLLNQVIEDPVPVSYQHVIIWGGMHGVIPIALALSLGPDVPFEGQLRTAVFGVVVASMILQGLSMTSVLEATGVT